MDIYISIINRLPLRKATGVVESFGVHAQLLIINCFFFYIGFKCHFNYFVLYVYIYIYTYKQYMHYPDEGPRRTETKHFLIKSLELMCHTYIF